MTRSSRTGEAGGDEPLVLIGDGTLDRLPGLSLIFEATAAKFSRFFNQYVDGAVLAIEGLEAFRVSDLAEQFADFGKTVVLRDKGMDFRAAIVADHACLGLIFELLLGSGAIASAPNRPLTRIEDRIVGFAVLNLGSAFADAFAELSAVAFERDAASEEAGFFALGPRATVTILARMTLQYREHYGRLLIALPRSAFDPFRAALSRLPGTEGQATDEKWSENLYDNVVRTEVTAEVKIEARGFTLGDVAGLEVGDVLRLPIAPTSPIRVVSEGRTLFWCTLGQKDGMYTVRLEEFSDERESYVENILGV